ncbi:MAG: NAD-dependent epimerase/dehydratase family protein [Acidimicrobiales bacterium]
MARGEVHVVVGAGPVGVALSRVLVAEGRQVVVVSRSEASAGPLPAGVERRRADAADAAAIAAAATGATAIYNCANPAYHRWPTDWPPIAAGLLAAAERHGAVLVTLSNLYGYGPVDRPMTEEHPLASTGTKGRVRATMWADALAAHQAGRVRVTEARASDFVGPEVLESHSGERVWPRLLAGKTIRVVGSADQPHSWSYVPDVARTLATLGSDERAWGRAWHVPSPAPVSQRRLLTDLAAAAGAPAPRVATLPSIALTLAGLGSPTIREVKETLHQLERPWVLDASAAEDAFGLRATPYDEVIRVTARWWVDHLSAAA